MHTGSSEPINADNRSDRATQRESHSQQPESGSDVPSSRKFFVNLRWISKPAARRGNPIDLFVKGEARPKMQTSYLVVSGALSQMVKVRGACDKLLWI